jgi:hypothetical protein
MAASEEEEESGRDGRHPAARSARSHLCTLLKIFKFPEGIEGSIPPFIEEDNTRALATHQHSMLITCSRLKLTLHTPRHQGSWQ